MARLSLVPQERRFFDLFEQGAANLVEAADMIRDLLEEYRDVPAKAEGGGGVCGGFFPPPRPKGRARPVGRLDRRMRQGRPAGHREAAPPAELPEHAAGRHRAEPPGKRG